MKRLMVVLLVAFTAIPYIAGAQYLETTRQSVATPGDTYAGGWCDPNTTRSLTFDLESISGGTMLDLAIAKTVKEGIGWPGYYGFQDYNSGSGGFPAQNGNFFYNYSTCADNDRVYNLVYGKLRTTVPRKDLAVLRQTGTYIYYNTGSGMATSPNQTLSGLAKDATWGAFDYLDNYDDLAVTDGSQIRIYRNRNDGRVDSSAMFTSPIAATRIVLAQMNDNLYNPPAPTNKWDLVSMDGNTLSIRLNNGSNGFNSPQNINMGSAVYSFAVGDVNNDKFNDVVVAKYDEVRLYLNNGSGALNTTATWTLTGAQYVPGNPQVLIGDLGAPGDATRNDGWNDILVTGYETLVSIFINQGSGSYFTSSPQQSFYSGNFYTAQSKALLADIQNTGGLSLVWGDFLNVYTNSHTGNPAPAPPKNLTVAGAINQHPQLTWAGNTERDLNQYKVYRKFDFEPQYNLIATLGSSTTSYTDNYVTVGPKSIYTVSYFVKAVDVAQNASDPSNVVWRYYTPFKLGAGSIVPSEYALHQAYPNPFNPTTTIKYQLSEDGLVALRVFDVLGREVATLVDQQQATGYYSATFGGQDVSSGIYFARFVVTGAAGEVKYSKMSKLVLMK